MLYEVITKSFTETGDTGPVNNKDFPFNWRKWMKLNKLVSVVGFAAAIVSAQAFATVDSALPEYQKVSGISGNLSSVGSDTLANMMTLWAEEFKRVYPNVNIQIQAAGSSIAPPALTEGTAQIGPMSRKMKDGEIEAFEKRYGYKPTAIPVAVDALAVFVHKDNPVITSYSIHYTKLYDHQIPVEGAAGHRIVDGLAIDLGGAGAVVEGLGAPLDLQRRNNFV